MTYRRLEFAPRSPFHDIEATVGAIRSARPGISNHGVDQAVKKMLNGYKPRTKGRVVHLYGADIMTADLTTIPAWPWITAPERRRLEQHPVDGGAVIDDLWEDAGMRRLEMAGRLDRQNINRSVLITPKGLSQTYVWRLANTWMQEVTQADYDLILAIPANRRMWRDPDIHGPYVDVRSYAGEGRVVHIARDMDDVKYAATQLRRTNHHMGASLPKEA